MHVQIVASMTLMRIRVVLVMPLHVPGHAYRTKLCKQLLIFPSKLFQAEAPKGTKSCRMQGESVDLSVGPPPCPILQALSPLRCKSKLYGLNPSKMAQIPAKCPKYPSNMAQIWLGNQNFGPSIHHFNPLDLDSGLIPRMWLLKLTS